MKTRWILMMKISTGTVMLLSLLLFVTGCSKSSMNNLYGTGGNGGNNGGPGTNEVWIQGMAFDPASITVTPGTTITWTNKDAIAHTVTSDSSLFDSGAINSGKTFSHTFATAGTFSYHCSIHPYMTAKVIVSTASATTASVSISNMSFIPSTLTITAGTTVTWTNNDSTAHTVTSDTGLFDSGSISAGGGYSGGGSYSHTFETAGTYKYHCKIHPTMTGTIIVN